MKTVHIYGAARNLREAPAPDPGVEVWLSNSPTTTMVRCPRAMDYWTRWFNLHSREHMVKTYPAGFYYYGHHPAQKPVYLQKVQPDVPSSVVFPRENIQAMFATAKGPNRYFTCSACWLIAFAILEGFERIEMWGFELRDTKPGGVYAFERPCVAYWIQQARDHGISVWYQDALERLYAAGALIPGDPDTYTGPLYGYSTKAEPDWDPVTESFTKKDL